MDQIVARLGNDKNNMFSLLCQHEGYIIIDQEFHRVDMISYDVYNICQCPRGHIFTLFAERKRISRNLIRSMFV
jgi:hypothetical protein